jgi:hypothetical protein
MMDERKSFITQKPHKNVFLLSNRSQARNTIKADNFGLHYDDFFSKRKADLHDAFMVKKNMLAGEF